MRKSLTKSSSNNSIGKNPRITINGLKVIDSDIEEKKKSKEENKS